MISARTAFKRTHLTSPASVPLFPWLVNGERRHPKEKGRAQSHTASTNVLVLGLGPDPLQNTNNLPSIGKIETYSESPGLKQRVLGGSWARPRWHKGQALELSLAGLRNTQNNHHTVEVFLWQGLGPGPHIPRGPRVRGTRGRSQATTGTGREARPVHPYFQARPEQGSPSPPRQPPLPAGWSSRQGSGELLEHQAPEETHGTYRSKGLGRSLALTGPRGEAGR